MQELRPLIWFQFFSSEEDKALQTWESSIMGAPEATPTVTPQATASSPSPPQPQKLPQDLQWVAEHYNPQQRAAELLADRRRSASVLSGASGLRSPGELFIVNHFSKRKDFFSRRKKTNSLTV